MKRNLIIGLLTAGAIFCASAVSAKELQGVSFPDQIKLGDTSLALNGLGLRLATAFNVKVYVAALYVTQPTNNAAAILGSNTPKELTLHFLRNVDGPDLSKAWKEGFEKNAKDQLSALQKRINKLESCMSDMKKGERLTFTYTPGKGVEVNVGGKVAGTIEGEDFAKAFFSIWLGAEPPNKELKTGLLGTAG